MKVYLSTCAWRDMDLTTVMSIVQSLRHPEMQIYWGAAKGDALIGRSRSMEATKFLNNPSLGDILISVDSDIQFSPTDFYTLAKDVESGYDIIGGIYATRDPDAPRPAVRLPLGSTVTIGEGEQVPAIYTSTGFMGVHRKVFEAMSKVLPLCRSGNAPELYPFFMAYPIQQPDGSYELLSEDWGMVEAAKKLGFKCWVDPRLRVGHLGMRTFRMDDINVGEMMESYTITEGTTDRTNIIRDLSAFLKKSPADVWSLLKSTPANITAQEWQESSPSTPTEIRNFYCNSKSYLTALARFNLRADYWSRLAPILGVSGSVADFGGGIGTLALYLLKQCNKIYYIDLPSLHRNFAEFRFSRIPAGEQKMITVLDSLDGLFNLDHIVSSDALEHLSISELKMVIPRMYLALKKGGSVLAICDFGPSESYPMHQSSKEEFEALMRDTGFTGGPTRWTK